MSMLSVGADRDDSPLGARALINAQHSGAGRIVLSAIQHAVRELRLSRRVARELVEPALLVLARLLERGAVAAAEQAQLGLRARQLALEHLALRPLELQLLG